MSPTEEPTTNTPAENAMAERVLRGGKDIERLRVLASVVLKNTEARVEKVNKSVELGWQRRHQRQHRDCHQRERGCQCTCGNRFSLIYGVLDPSGLPTIEQGSATRVHSPIHGRLVRLVAEARGDSDTAVCTWLTWKRCPLGINEEIEQCGIFPINVHDEDGCIETALWEEVVHSMEVGERPRN
ncbi:hypothetical protein FOZ63_027659 [Perkinsus olseni]|uniref:Uncharacterized protein n=1 Tax=Perkinsus olseni TaxID=32597 RepID=A0A7J6UHW6_PEROL|nr:hypothetical protein FOZ63_027659 [Perkinsus olseni]